MIKNTDRFYALDVFRGMTIALMILVNNPGSWAYVYPQLRHAVWHGMTLTDLVFPFFLFIVGSAMAFSFQKFDFCRTKEIHQKIIKRTILIFLIGVATHLISTLVFDKPIAQFRIMGVLQRIALCYGAAAFLVLRFNVQKLWIIVIITLIGYWQILSWLGDYELQTNFALKLDSWILGESHLWKGNGVPFDPEGLLSTLPAITTTILGFFAGVMIQTATDQRDNIKKMMILGISLSSIGWFWSFAFPLNKQLWSSSYVLVSGGIAFCILAALVWLIDIKQYRSTFKVFEIFGTNSLFVFVASGLWTIALLGVKIDGSSLYKFIYMNGFVPWAGNMNGSLFFAISHVLLWWFILFILYRKNIHIKI